VIDATTATETSTAAAPTNGKAPGTCTMPKSFAATL